MLSWSFNKDSFFKRAISSSSCINNILTASRSPCTPQLFGAAWIDGATYRWRLARRGQAARAPPWWWESPAAGSSARVAPSPFAGASCRRPSRAGRRGTRGSCAAARTCTLNCMFSCGKCAIFHMYVFLCAAGEMSP